MLGLIARADDRGLGIMTWELARHLRPDRVLVVREPGAEAKGFAPHLDRYPDATVVTFAGGQLPEPVVREWLQGLGAVYSAETFYDWHAVTWAADAGVAQVLHVMPEFHHDHLPAGPQRWVPTPWRAEHVHGARLVPVPVATDRFTPGPLNTDAPLRVLHVAGHRAAQDRNGTNQLLQALRAVRQPIHVRIATQDPHLAAPRSTGRATVEVTTGGVANYWDTYADADVLVMPRRYGGLCLPVQEAMAAGLAVVMGDCPPNDWWPTLRVPGVNRGVLTTAAGALPLFATNPRALAGQLDLLATDRAALGAARAASLQWAAAHSWDALAPTYQAALAEVAETAPSDF